MNIHFAQKKKEEKRWIKCKKKAHKDIHIYCDEKWKEMALNKVMHKVVHNDVDNFYGEEVVNHSYSNTILLCSSLCRVPSLSVRKE